MNAPGINESRRDMAVTLVEQVRELEENEAVAWVEGFLIMLENAALRTAQEYVAERLGGAA